VDGFMGALPEGQVRAFLDKHVPSEGALEAEADVDEAHELLESATPRPRCQAGRCAGCRPHQRRRPL
jgi:thioredoxin-like negative regulator of GroEL